MIIFEIVKSEGIDYSNHESDLYIPVTERTKELIKDYEFKTNVTTFVSNIDQKLWYDVPFAYLPYWHSKQKA
jgi:hypothetical protein